MRLSILIAAVLASLISPAVAGDMRPVGHVNDFAGVLTKADAASLEKMLIGFEDTTKHQAVLLTVGSLDGEPVESYAVKIGNAWGIGRRGIDDGVLLLVSVGDRKARLEVGRGLRSIITDEVADEIMQDDIVPRFREADYSGGIMAGMRDVTRAIVSAESAETVPNVATMASSGSPQAEKTEKGDDDWSGVIAVLVAMAALISVLVYVINTLASAGRIADQRVALTMKLEDLKSRLATNVRSLKSAMEFDSSLVAESYIERAERLSEQIESYIGDASERLTERRFMDVFRGSMDISHKVSNLIGDIHYFVWAKERCEKVLEMWDAKAEEAAAIIADEHSTDEIADRLAEFKKPVLPDAGSRQPWAGLARIMTDMFEKYNSAVATAANEVNARRRSVIEGPVLLEKLNRTISQLPSSSEAASAYARARIATTEASAPGVDWVVYYPILLACMNDINSIRSTFSGGYGGAGIAPAPAPSSRSSSSSLSDTSSGGYSGGYDSGMYDSGMFGGGSFDGGGGSSGSW